MAKQLSSLADFLNHGITPIIGRDSELEMCVQFWQQSFESSVLRAMVIRGEAGIGKSTVMEHTARRIEELGGITITVRLRPQSSLGLVTLLHDDILRNEHAMRLLRQTPSNSLSDIVEAIGRFARLRLTAVIIEDIHLLSGDSLRDFMVLLQSVADEPISIFCTVRPVDAPALGVLEPFKTNERSLQGLASDAVVTLCAELFGSVPQGTEAQLLKVTKGNPMVLKSALRNVIKQSGLREKSVGTWETTETFSSVLSRSTESLADGMAVHLTADDILVAQKLSRLGEAFSREAALFILENNNTALQQLIVKGIVSESVTSVTALSDAVSVYSVLAFTHSLIHSAFLDDAIPLLTPADTEVLLRLLIHKLPLYSFVPFTCLQTSIPHVQYWNDEWIDAMRAIGTIAYLVDTTPNWEHSLGIWECEHLLWTTAKQFTHERTARYAEVLATLDKLAIMVRKVHTPEFLNLAQYCITQTEDAISPHEAEYRLSAFSNYHQSLIRSGAQKTLQQCWDEVQELLQQYPVLQTSTVYTSYIHSMLFYGVQLPEHLVHDMIPVLEHAMNNLWQQLQPITPKQQIQYNRARTQLLLAHNTRTEYEQRKRDFAELSAQYIREMWFIPKCSAFLFDSFSANQIIANYSEWYKMYSLRNLHCGGLIAFYQASQILTGKNHNDVVEQIRTSHAGMPNPQAEWFANDVGNIVMLSLLLIGYYDVARSVQLEYVPQNDFLTAIWNIEVIEDVQQVLEIAHQIKNDSPQEIKTVADILTSIHHPEELQRVLTDYTKEYYETFFHTFGLSMMLNVLERFASTEVLKFLQPTLQPLLSNVRKKFEHEQLHVVMERWSGMYPRVFGSKESTQWKSSAKKIKLELEIGNTSVSSGKIHLRMFANISCSIPGVTERKTPQGARVKLLLGALVANLMRTTPLLADDFVRLVAEENVVDSDTRNIFNVALHRTRELIGKEAIITSDITPQLNRSLVTIDIVECMEHIALARTEIRRGNLYKSVQYVRQVLITWNGDVAFPTLYNPIFEQLREEFENTIRTVTITLLNALHREGDVETLRALQQQFLRCLPEDEEIQSMHIN